MTAIEKLQIALSKLREIRTSTAGLGGVEAIIKDVISDLEKPKCKHPTVITVRWAYKCENCNEIIQ